MVKNHNDISLLPLNTFGIDVRCSRLVEFETHEDLKTVFEDNDLKNRHWGVLGGGSNIIFTGDFDGVLLHPAGKGIAVLSENPASLRVRAEAGVVWDDFALWCADRGCWGAENLSGIPGSVGAAPVQNIGAYGAEAKDIIEFVELFCAETSSALVLDAGHCGFGYRSSVFKGELKGRVVITAVNFRLSKLPAPKLAYGDLLRKTEQAGGATLRNIRNAVLDIRNSKLPDPAVIGNAGSFFKNPVVSGEKAAGLRSAYPGIPLYPSGLDGCAKLAAGWLIEQCGWKGGSMGRAGVHDRQALVLVNLGGASGKEVLALASRIRSDVAAKFGVDIEMEVNIV